MNTIEIRTVDVVQYITPLREGGSMPAIVKGSDDFLYVLKFRGAGQGKKALISDFIGAELARAIGLKVPEIVFMNLVDTFSRTEPDEEIQDLLKFSEGLNLGLHFLSEAITFDPVVTSVNELEASLVVLLDSIISNIDRTVKNTNLLNWRNELWLIDHGASFYFHHDWESWKNHLPRTFPLVKNHVLLERANKMPEAIAQIQTTLTDEKIKEIIGLIPEDWLQDETEPFSPDEMREAYVEFIHSRLKKIEELAKEATDAR